ncbi:polyprenyl synthetase family protein [Roseospira goensis]|nr:farnesyl diphosphate synthase [Roseospira goensis]
MAETSEAVGTRLSELLPPPDAPEARVLEAMRYAAMGGGKRLRPFLVVRSAALFNVSPSAALTVAAALEMVHTYSLVHDDLPAMDDDDLRRGRPTCHRQFDEATAILAGDALLTRAFEILADPASHADPAVRCELVRELAEAAGARGMVGGQMVDLMVERGIGDLSMDVAAITRMHQLKTGRLISFACLAGPIMGKAPARMRACLQAYARDLGLAFQIADDVLDETGSAQDLGKTPGKDAAAGKTTFVTLLGLDGARERARLLSDQAVGHLEVFGPEADLLRAVARYVVERDR